MIIAITGVPCTGKSTVSRLLSERLGYGLLSFKEIAEKAGAIVGFDEDMDAGLVDLDKLKGSVKRIDGDKIIEGHLSHELPADLVIVLRCNPRTLETRLVNRYPENPRKVKENVQSEILGVITSEAINANVNVYEVDVTGKEVEDIIGEILKVVKGNFKGQKVFVDWLQEFEGWLI
ncbi:hypothetical protein A3K63_01010 [Candidatus Micrarchaeota archaeon RBG_16_49_10]|nr:MAG: hypothetical protein A3K63_01010 [Candidatus Micrarchaeota archaeon RBG_16_49_10]